MTTGVGALGYVHPRPLNLYPHTIFGPAQYTVHEVVWPMIDLSLLALDLKLAWRGKVGLPARRSLDVEEKTLSKLVLTYNYRLTLTAANRVFIVEPQWNPSVENQAIGRALRIGQGREVTVTRYIMSGTIEQVSNISDHCWTLKY